MKIISEKVVGWHKPGVPGAEPHPVIVQQLAGDRCPWRIEFASQGRYFREEEEMRQYLFERFKVVLK